MIEGSGGGENFMSFIQKELIPYIDSNYPTESYKMLIGHSFGGLTVVNTLMRRPNLFDSYVAIDPSLWWNDEYLLNEIVEGKFDSSYSQKRLYVGVANTMSEGMDIANVLKDTTIQTRTIRSILKFDTFFKEKVNKQKLYKGKYYKNYNHATVPLIAEYDAFHFIFDFYEFKTNEEEFLNPRFDFLEKIISHYDNISKVLKTKEKPDKGFIEYLGYHRISEKQYKQAEEFFKLNLINFPKNYSVYDSLGDYYAVVGDKEKAIENYKKSLSLNKDSVSKLKLLELKTKDSISIDRLSEIENE